MVHGGAGYVQRDRCWPNPRSKGDSATLAPLQEGVVHPAVRMALEPHSLTDSGLGGPGTPGTSQRSPTSSSTDARHPCSPPQRSFPSCPTDVPGPEESRAFARHNCRTHRTDWGSAAGAGKRRALSPGAAPAISPPRRGVGKRASTAGGGRRLGAGAGGGKEAGREIRPRVDGRCVWWESGPATRTLYSPGPQLLSPPRRRGPSPESQASGVFEVLGRILTEEERCVPGPGTLAWPKGPFAFCLRVWGGAPRWVAVGERAHVACSSPTAPRSV